MSDNQTKSPKDHRVRSIREDFDIHEGPLDRGWPTWTIHDLSKDSYIRIGQKDLLMLQAWDLKQAGLIADEASHQFVGDITAEDVIDFEGFLYLSGLLAPSGAIDTTRMAASRKKQSWIVWAIHHYLFIRIKTGNPDNLFKKMSDILAFLYTPVFLIFWGLLIIVCGLDISAEWADYSSDFSSYLTPSGLLMGGLAIAVAKTVHEFGHGVTARHYGCRVPACGVAFLVMAPVLWTDTTGVWRLKSRQQRLMVDASGMIAELLLATLATLAWIFVPDGAFRHLLFILSSTTWIMTLAVNLSPLMRFDGYHILGDALGIPNLMTRAFAYSCWKLRYWVLGTNEPEPDDFTDRQKIAVLIYSPATWIYRIGLFTGIALVVYHATFRALGLILMSIEIVGFVLLPIYREACKWVQLIRRKEVSMKKTSISLAVFVGILVLTFIPLSHPFTIQGVISPETFVLKSHSGEITSWPRDGAFVKKGEVILGVTDPLLSNKVMVSQLDARTMEDTLTVLSQEVGQSARMAKETGDSENTLRDTEDALVKSESEVHQNETTLKNKNIVAPFDGVVQSMDELYDKGSFIQEGHVSGILVSQKWQVFAYIPERMIPYISKGDHVRIYTQGNLNRFNGIIHDISHGAQTTLPDVSLSSVYGGPVPSHKTEQGLEPDGAWYRVTVDVPGDNFFHPEHVMVSFPVRDSSLAERTLKKAASLFAQESGM